MVKTQAEEEAERNTLSFRILEFIWDACASIVDFLWEMVKLVIVLVVIALLVTVVYWIGHDMILPLLQGAMAR